MERLSSLFINPVLNKEIKLRFRSFKNFLGIFLYLAVCGAACLAFIYIETSFTHDGFTSQDSRNLFMILSMGQLGLVVFITPGLTAGAISGEREKQTLNIMLTTQQSSTSIVLSKLFSSLLFLVLMLVASLPLYSLVFLYGGVSPKMVSITFGIQLLTMLTIGSLGILFSTIIRKTMVATITTYGVMLFLTVGTIIIFFISFQLIMGANQGQFGGVNPSSYIFPYIVLALNPAVSMFMTFDEGVFVYELQQLGIEWPFWLGFVVSYSVLTILSLLIAIKSLRPSMKTKRRKKKG